MEKIQNRVIKPSTICFVALLCVFALVATAAESKRRSAALRGRMARPVPEGKTAPEKVRITPDGDT